jgi:putative nucleotidyltransferase with HDIG domain
VQAQPATATATPTSGATALRDRLAECDAAIPMLPDFAHKVIALVSDPDVSIAHLSDIVSKDQVLASRLLGMANSAYFASMQEISTVQEAIMRMGTGAVRNLVVTVCFYSRMHDRNVYGDQGRPLLEHGIGTAYMARVIAEQIGDDEDEAFMYGLLHDIGKLVILKVAHDARRQSGLMVAPEDLESVMAEMHPVVGARVLRRWHLPTMLDDPIVYHHEWQKATVAPRKAALTYLANRLSHRYGFGCEAEEFDPLTDPASIELGLDAAWLEQVDAKAPGLFDIARKILG